jgi:hypothetical protein
MLAFKLDGSSVYALTLGPELEALLTLGSALDIELARDLKQTGGHLAEN